MYIYMYVYIVSHFFELYISINLPVCPSIYLSSVHIDLSIYLKLLIDQFFFRLFQNEISGGRAGGRWQIYNRKRNYSKLHICWHLVSLSVFIYVELFMALKLYKTSFWQRYCTAHSAPAFFFALQCIWLPGQPIFSSTQVNFLAPQEKDKIGGALGNLPGH